MPRAQATDRARIVPDGQEAQVPQVQDEQERPTILLHFHHCTCDLQGSRKVEQRRSSCRDVQVPRSTRRARAPSMEVGGSEGRDWILKCLLACYSSLLPRFMIQIFDINYGQLYDARPSYEGA